MRIAIIGAGQVGLALGTGWSKARHDIVFGVREPADNIEGINSTSVAIAARDAEIVVLAVPWHAAEDAIAACGDLNGRIMLDVTNPVAMVDGKLRLALGFDFSGGEQVAAWAKGASVFKTMNQVGFQVMADASGFPTRPTMFVAGDDETKKPLVMGLVKDLGFSAMNAGDLAVARLLEPYAMLWIHMALSVGAPQDGAFALMRRNGTDEDA